MPDKRLTQSPRQIRESTNDPEAHAIGKVPEGWYSERQSDADKHISEQIEEFGPQGRESGFGPAV